MARVNEFITYIHTGPMNSFGQRLLYFILVLYIYYN